MAPRKTSAAPTRIWKFGALPPRENASIVAQQLELAEAYYAQLIEIHRDRWFGQRRILRQYCPAFAALDEQCRELSDQIKAVYEKTKEARAKLYRETGVKALIPPDDQHEVDRIKDERAVKYKERSAALKAHYATHDETKKAFKRRVAELSPNNHTMAAAKESVLAEMLDAPESWLADRRIEADCVKKLKEVRAACGLQFGTYLQTEVAADKAAKDRMKLGQPAYHDPDRKRSGKVAVQITKRSDGSAVTWSDLIAGRCNAFRLTHVGDEKHTDRYIAHLRVASTESRDPVFTEVPVLLHRQPPGDAVVKWAWLSVKNGGKRTKYEIQVTLEHQDFALSKRPAGIGDGGHIRIGWGAHSDGVLVATGPWDVVVPRRILQQAERASDVEKIAEEMCQGMFVASGVDVQTLPSDANRAALRNECIDAATQLGLNELWDAWRHHRRYGGCPRKNSETRREWRAALAAHGKDLFCSKPISDKWLEKQVQAVSEADKLTWYRFLWALKDKHLQQYEASARRRHVEQRDAFFRAESIRIATAFETVTVDNYDIAKLKKLPELTMPDNRRDERSQRHLQHAAPGRFREILLEVMGTRCKKCERPGGIEIPGTARKAKSRSKRAPKAAE